MNNIDRRFFLTKSTFLGIGAMFSNSEIKNSILNTANIRGEENRSEMCQVEKELYAAFPKPGMAIVVNISYIGRKGVRREEIRSFMESSDWSQTVLRRTSEDNGRTWSDFYPLTIVSKGDGEFTQGGGASQSGTGPYDPISGCLIKPVFQRIFHGAPQVALKNRRKYRTLWDHGFYQLSEDDGKTWSEAYLLKYEDGPDFDKANWGKKEFLESNEMYIGNNSIVLKNGTVIIPSSIPIPYWEDGDEDLYKLFPTYKERSVAGAICFIGKWNSLTENYDWKKSNSIFLPKHVSSRGLTELEICQLKSGNLLLIMRGSNTGLNIKDSPGRKWFSVSSDGGLEWSEVKEMRYDTGEQFYSPASISKTIRSSKTGNLYWIGNISSELPNGNNPRYPLYIAEVDEDNISLKKETITVIDDRDINKDSEDLQLSNFSIIEDRETKNIEIYLTRLGEIAGGNDVWTANTYKYTIIL